MKYLLLPTLALLLTSCAEVAIKKTYVSSSAHDPIAIYIREFDISKTKFKGDWGDQGELELRKHQAPAEFAKALKEELEKIAPAMVIRDDQAPKEGWIVDGEFDEINSGYRLARGIFGIIGSGQSQITLHVKVSDAKSGRILYAFDVAGSSGLTGPFGNTGAPGIGYARSFSYKNAAEEIMIALSLDPKVEGLRSTP